MVMTDPIADMLTRIRNANMVRHEKLEVPASKIKKEIAELLKREGFIRDVEYIEDNKQGILRIFLKYGVNNERVITGLKRISKPGLRVYAKADEVPRVRDFRGVSKKAFDGRGNYTLGVKEQLIFPEIDYDKVTKVRGMDIVIVTTANTDEESRELLTQFGMPFQK